MAKYPVKMLKDEQNQPFVPLVSAESIYTNDDLSFEEKFATKLEADNLKEGNGIILEQNGNDTTISVDFGATDNIIDNLNTTVAGQGPLDARQGNVLKNMIPVIVDNLDSTDATKVLSANQGHELKEMSVPTGGATGQVLKKASDDDHSLEWGDAADPNAIVGDGSIMKIIELTYAEYKTLESNGELREDTEYHITDVENGTSSILTTTQIQSMIDNTVQNYILLSGGQLTGSLAMPKDLYVEDEQFGLDMNNSDIIGVNGIYTMDAAQSQDEGIHFTRTDGKIDTLRGYDGRLYWHVARTIGADTTATYTINTDYQPGDTYSIVLPTTNPVGAGSFGGALSNSNTELRFVIFTHRGLDKISSITVNAMRLNVRHSDGGYIGASSSITGGYDFLANYSVTAIKGGSNTISIVVKSSSSFGYTNNCPISIEPNEIRLTFN